MECDVCVDCSIVTANARAWRAFAGAPLYAVVKSDGYGWGVDTLVTALEGHVDAFCVSDEAELRDLRRCTATRAIVLGGVPLERLGAVYEKNALPTIGSAAELAALERAARANAVPLRVRVGLRPAVGWSGLSFDELRAFAPSLVRSGAQVELWTHLTDVENRAEALRRFEEALRALAAAGVAVVRTDVASTIPLAADGARIGGAHSNGQAGNSSAFERDDRAVRIGAGLFGATGGVRVAGIRCALRVVAPVTEIEEVDAGTKIGYGATTFERPTPVVTARCGYADGLPRSLAGSGGIISIGMQYVTAVASRLDQSAPLVLLDERSDLDAFAARAGRLPHEIITGFGNAASARAFRRPPQLRAAAAAAPDPV